jgi:hypothetical protein
VRRAGDGHRITPVRTLFFVLLLLNLLVFLGWQSIAPRNGSNDALASGVARVALASEAPARPKRCITIGPFRDASETAAANNLLREVGYQPRSRIETGQQREGFVVLLNTLRSSSQLDSAMSKLRLAGIRDTAIVPDGGPGIRVSVGQFQDLAGAEQRASVVRRLGMRADVMERVNDAAATWLDLDLREAGEELDPKTFKSDGSLQVKPCPSAS